MFEAIVGVTLGLSAMNGRGKGHTKQSAKAMPLSQAILDRIHTGPEAVCSELHAIR
jgi:hypothetical protein